MKRHHPLVIALHSHKEVSQNEADLGPTEGNDNFIASFANSMRTHGNALARKRLPPDVEFHCTLITYGNKYAYAQAKDV